MHGDAGEHEEEISVMFKVYRDCDIGMDDPILLQSPDTKDQLVDLDCDSEEEVVEWDIRKCFEECSWALNECEALGSHLVTTVLLRNPDIHERCSKPELFDRFGKLKEDYMGSVHPDLTSFNDYCIQQRARQEGNGDDASEPSDA